MRKNEIKLYSQIKNSKLKGEYYKYLRHIPRSKEDFDCHGAVNICIYFAKNRNKTRENNP